MKIKKILIVPFTKVVTEESDSLRESSIFMHVARYAKNHIFNRTAFKRKSEALCGEVLYYGDAPRILGKENVYVFGRYRPRFLSKDLYPRCTHPHCLGTPEPTFIGKDELKSIIKQVDVVLLSVHAGERGRLALMEAQAEGKPVAMINIRNYYRQYGTPERIESLYCGYKKGEDFEIFFKKDLPLGYRSEFLLPLVPSPVRPELFSFVKPLPKDIDIFYSGVKYSLGQMDRIETAELVHRNFKKVFLQDHRSSNRFLPLEEYWNLLSRSKLSLAPSGQTWDSTRLCESVFAPLTAVISPKPDLETTGPELRDGVNAILYDTKLGDDGSHHLSDADILLEKIRYYLEHQKEREQLALNWKKDVLEGHTVLARTRYMLESMERILS